MPQPLSEIKCKSCGELFTPKRAWQEFCNDKCRNNYHNDKKYGMYRTEPQRAPIKCPYCKSESDQLSPNIIEVIRERSNLAPRQYLCNVCARIFVEEEPDGEHPPFTGLVDKNLK